MVLHQHTWSILHVDSRIQWATSDDPVICLNYNLNGTYDFGGGWGRHGSDILFPLSPYHMLYTQVGKKSELHIELTYEKSIELQRIIAEHSHRCIYAKKPLKYIEDYRPRVIDDKIFKNEINGWNNWNDEQSSADKKIIEKKRMKKEREPKHKT